MIKYIICNTYAVDKDVLSLLFGMFVNIFDMIDNVGQGQTSYLTLPNFWECAWQKVLEKRFKFCQILLLLYEVYELIFPVFANFEAFLLLEHFNLSMNLLYLKSDLASSISLRFGIST